MLTLEFLKALHEKGLTLADAIELVEAAGVGKRSSAATRQARYRERQKESVTSNVTESVTRDVTRDVTSSPDNKNPPDPLKQLTPSKENPPKGGQKKGGPEGFDEWWQVYPRREARGHAERAYLAAKKLASQEELVAGARRYARSQPDPKYQKHPATWLNGKCWLDEAPAKPNGGRGPRPVFSIAGLPK